MKNLLIILFCCLSLQVWGQDKEAETYYKNGLEKYNLKKYQEAILDFDKVISLSPNDVNAYWQRGLSKFYLKQPDVAILDFDRVIQLSPNFAEGYYMRGRARYAKSPYKSLEIMPDYDKAIELKPTIAEFYLHRAIANNSFMSVELYAESMSKATTNLINIGKSKEQQKQYDINKEEGSWKYAKLIIADLDKFLTLIPTPKDNRAYYYRGISKKVLEKYQEAILDFDKAIQLAPKDEKSYEERAETNFALGKYKEAIADFDKAIELDPEYAGAYRQRAKAKEKLGLKAESAADEAKADEIYKKNKDKK